MASKYAVKLEQVSKSYMIGHSENKNQRYFALRDVIADGYKTFLKNGLSLIKGKPLIAGDSFEEFKALKNINLTINEGDRVGVVGRNGAGKSTLLKLLSRITEPTEGRIRIRGRIASLLEVGTGFNSELTGRENIFLNGAIMGMSEREIRSKFDEIVSFSEVENFIDTPVKRYSSGMYVRLAFAVAAHLDPEILIIDEVLAVGDMNFRTKCLGKMQSLGQSGRTVIFVSHDMSMVRRLCDKAVLLDQGGILNYGETDEITSQYEKLGFLGISDIPAVVERDLKPNKFGLRKIELKNGITGETTAEYKAGDLIIIHLWSNCDAPQDYFTIEFHLYNQKGDLISIGSANPITDCYFKRKDRHFILKLGPIPLTSGMYSLRFSTRIWGQERWDDWEHAIGFCVTRCDFFNTGYDAPSGYCGDFMIPHNWSVSD